MTIQAEQQVSAGQRLFTRAPAYDLVFACLSPRALVRLALTCRAARLAARDFVSRAFDVNRHLSRYFSDPLAFRSMQARTNTLVSGSNALQFLDRTFYPEADLDLYTHPGHALEVAEFLVSVEGYRYAPRPAQSRDWRKAIRDVDVVGLTRRRRVPASGGHGYPTTSIAGVWTFQKEDGGRVQVIEAHSSPFEAILGFHSTCVMNFIASDAAYALYPVATFEDRSALGMPRSRNSPEAIRKYVRRGWRVYYVPTPDNPFVLERSRWVADKYTWVLPLDQTGVRERPRLNLASAALPCDPALCNGWRLVVRPKPRDDVHDLPEDAYKLCYQPHYYPVKTTLFRYNYAVPDVKVQLAIRDWAEEQERLSHVQIPKENWIWFDSDIRGFFSQKVRSCQR